MACEQMCSHNMINALDECKPNLARDPRDEIYWVPLAMLFVSTLGMLIPMFIFMMRCLPHIREEPHISEVVHISLVIVLILFMCLCFYGTELYQIWKLANSLN